MGAPEADRVRRTDRGIKRERESRRIGRESAALFRELRSVAACVDVPQPQGVFCPWDVSIIP